LAFSVFFLGRGEGGPPEMVQKSCLGGAFFFTVSQIFPPF